MISAGEIKICAPNTNLSDKVLRSREVFKVDTPSGNEYTLSLTDENVEKSFAPNALSQVCKDRNNNGYYIPIIFMKSLREQLDPNKRQLSFLVTADEARDYKIQQYLESPPNKLDKSPDNDQKYFFIKIKLGKHELASIRYALNDDLDPQKSMVRLVPDPLLGSQNEITSFNIAISKTVNNDAYRSIIDELSLFKNDVLDQARGIRADVIVNALTEAGLGRNEPEKPIVAPDSLFGNAEAANKAKNEIVKLLTEKPLPKETADMADYVLFEKALFPYEVSLLRWAAGDKDNSLFVAYNNNTQWKEDVAESYYVKIDFSVMNKEFTQLREMIDALVVSSIECKNDQACYSSIKRIDALKEETLSAVERAKEKSLKYKTWESGPAGAAFAVPALTGAAAATTVGVLWCFGRRIVKAVTKKVAGTGAIGVLSVLDLVPTANIERWMEKITNDKNDPSPL